MKEAWWVRQRTATSTTMPTGTAEFTELLSSAADLFNPLSRYGGGDGIYTHTVAYEMDPHCLECSPAVLFGVRPDMTLQEVRACVHSSMTITNL